MRKGVNMLQSIRGVYRTVEQNSLSYADNLRKLRPDYVVHGDDWKSGVQKPIRDEVVSILNEYGGELVEYPYSNDERYRALEQRSREHLSIPDIRRGRLRDLLAMKPTVSILEAHSGITGLIAENTVVVKEGKAFQFDGMWVSSLCDSTAKGKPDIELVDMSSRLRTIDDIMEVTTKPIILDGDTGGLIEHFVYNIKTLERMGVSAVIIEDKTGLKKEFPIRHRGRADPRLHRALLRKNRRRKKSFKDKRIYADRADRKLDFGAGHGGCLKARFCLCSCRRGWDNDSFPEEISGRDFRILRKVP